MARNQSLERKTRGNEELTVVEFWLFIKGESVDRKLFSSTCGKKGRRDPTIKRVVVRVDKKEPVRASRDHIEDNHSCLVHRGQGIGDLFPDMSRGSVK